MKLKARTSAPAHPSGEGPPSSSVGFNEGDLVQWHDEGLRAGYYIKSLSPTVASVRPIGAYKATRPRAKEIPMKDLHKVARAPLARRRPDGS